MKVEVEDFIGTYKVNTKNRPEIFDRADLIYLNIFDNGENPKACRYKLVLVVEDTNNGDRQEWTCKILNKFEPARWLANIPQEARDVPFFKGIQYFFKNLLKTNDHWIKRPSAGFFKPFHKKSNNRTDRKNIYNAIGYMWIEETGVFAGFRFQDFVWSGELTENPSSNHKAPKWSVCIKSNMTNKDLIEDDEFNMDDYF